MAKPKANVETISLDGRETCSVCVVGENSFYPILIRSDHWSKENSYLEITYFVTRSGKKYTGKVILPFKGTEIVTRELIIDICRQVSENIGFSRENLTLDPDWYDFSSGRETKDNPEKKYESFAVPKMPDKSNAVHLKVQPSPDFWSLRISPVVENNYPINLLQPAVYRDRDRYSIIGCKIVNENLQLVVGDKMMPGDNRSFVFPKITQYFTWETRSCYKYERVSDVPGKTFAKAAETEEVKLLLWNGPNHTIVGQPFPEMELDAMLANVIVGNFNRTFVSPNEYYSINRKKTTMTIRAIERKIQYDDTIVKRKKAEARAVAAKTKNQDSKQPEKPLADNPPGPSQSQSNKKKKGKEKKKEGESPKQPQAESSKDKTTKKKDKQQPQPNQPKPGKKNNKPQGKAGAKIPDMTQEFMHKMLTMATRLENIEHKLDINN